MKNLEKKILDKVYRYEAKRTFLETVLRSVIVLLMVVIIIVLGQVIVQIFSEQQTFAVLQIFKEDREIIQKHASETLSTIYEESPKELILLIITGILLFVLVIYHFIKNITKIRNKLSAIIKHWRQ